MGGGGQQRQCGELGNKVRNISGVITKSSDPSKLTQTTGQAVAHVWQSQWSCHISGKPGHASAALCVAASAVLFIAMVHLYCPLVSTSVLSNQEVMVLLPMAEAQFLPTQACPCSALCPARPCLCAVLCPAEMLPAPTPPPLLARRPFTACHPSAPICRGCMQPVLPV